MKVIFFLLLISASCRAQNLRGDGNERLLSNEACNDCEPKEEAYPVGCFDSPFNYYYMLGGPNSGWGSVTCDEVGKFHMDKCRSGEAVSHCPRTCGACESRGCRDSGRWFQKVWNHCEDDNCKQPGFQMTCPEKCDMCNSCAPRLWTDPATPSDADVCANKPGEVAVDGMCYSCALLLEGFKGFNSATKSAWCESEKSDEAREHCPTLCTPGCQ